MPQILDFPQERFYIEDKFYDDILDYIEELIEDFDSLYELPDDFTEQVYLSEVRPVYRFTANELMDLIPEEDLPSTELRNSDELEKDIFKIIEKHLVDLNKELPEFIYRTNKYYMVTKDELIECFNANK